MYAHYDLTSNRLQEIVMRCHRFVKRAWDPYRPELHYMRGPGPKWNAKHQSSLPF